MRWLVTIIGAAAALIIATTAHGTTSGPALRIVTRSTGNPVTEVGQVFLKQTYVLNYTGGQILLAGAPNGTGQIDFDDVASVKVKHTDGTISTWQHDFSNNCLGTSDVPVNPVNLSTLFKLGVNTVTIRGADKCGGVWGEWETWLVLP